MSDKNPLLNSSSVQGAASSIEGLIDPKTATIKPQEKAAPVEQNESEEAQATEDNQEFQQQPKENLENKIQETLFTSAGGYGTTSYTQNKGRAERMKFTSFNPAAAEIANYKTAANCNVSAKNYCTVATDKITYFVTANLPCKFLHDIFDKLPIVKSAYIRLILNLNTQLKGRSTRSIAGSALVHWASDREVEGSIHDIFGFLVCADISFSSSFRV